MTYCSGSSSRKKRLQKKKRSHPPTRKHALEDPKWFHVQIQNPLHPPCFLGGVSYQQGDVQNLASFKQDARLRRAVEEGWCGLSQEPISQVPTAVTSPTGV